MVGRIDRSLSGTRRTALGGPALLFVTALVLRLAALAAVYDPTTSFEKFPLLARRLIENGWVVHEPFGYSPAYIYYLALLIRAGATPLGLCIAQAVLGAFTCVLVRDLGIRLFGPVEGRVAGGLAAVFGPFLIFSIELESDGLGLLLYCAAATALLAAIERPSWWRFASSGLLLGLRAAQRPDAILLAVVLAVVLAFWTVRAARPVLRLAPAILLAGCVVPLLPITWQNYRAAGEFIPVTSSGGWVFYTSQNHSASGLSYFPPPLAYALMNAPQKPGQDPLDRLDDRLSRRLASLAAGTELTPGAASRFWRAEGIHSIEQRGFLRQIGLQLRKLYYALHAYEGQDSLALLIDEHRLGFLTGFGMGLLAPLALFGLALAWRHQSLTGPRRFVVLALLASPLVSMSLFYVGSRFRLELEALFMPFAAATLLWMVRRAGAGEWRFLATALAILVPFTGLLFTPDREIRRQQRMRLIQLETNLGERAPSVDVAEAAFTRAVDAARYPAEAEAAWNGLARIARGRGDGSAAGRCEAFASGFLDDVTRQRLEAQGDDPEALWAVGRHFMLRGETSKAAEALAAAERLAPDDPDILLSRALAAFQAGTAPPDTVAAWTERALQSGLRFSTNAAVAYRLAARCDERLGRHDAAESFLRQAVRFEAVLR